MENRFQTPPQFGQGVLYPRRHFCVDLPINQTVLLHLPELLGSIFWLIRGIVRCNSPKRFIPARSSPMISTFHLSPMRESVVSTGHSVSWSVMATPQLLDII